MKTKIGEMGGRVRLTYRWLLGRLISGDRKKEVILFIKPNGKKNFKCEGIKNS
jgi:hypothetical protein